MKSVKPGDTVYIGYYNTDSFGNISRIFTEKYDYIRFDKTHQTRILSIGGNTEHHGKGTKIFGEKKDALTYITRMAQFHQEDTIRKKEEQIRDLTYQRFLSIDILTKLKSKSKLK